MVFFNCIRLTRRARSVYWSCGGARGLWRIWDSRNETTHDLWQLVFLCFRASHGSVGSAWQNSIILGLVLEKLKTTDVIMMLHTSCLIYSIKAMVKVYFNFQVAYTCVSILSSTIQMWKLCFFTPLHLLWRFRLHTKQVEYKVLLQNKLPNKVVVTI